MKTLFTLMLILTLSGCALFERKPEILVPTQPDRVHIDSKLLESCEPLSKIAQDSDLSMEMVLLVKKYGDCALKQEGSIRAIKILTNRE